MSQISQDNPLGNTKKPRGLSKYQCVNYAPCTFWGCDKYTPSQLSQFLKGFCKEFYFQIEKAPDTGKLHYQLAFKCKEKLYWQQVANIFGTNSGIHLEQPECWFEAKNYCIKEDTRYEGPWDHTSTFLKTLSPSQFYPWQQSTFNKLKEEPDDRTIIWIFGAEGCKGKTQFCKYMLANHKGTMVFNNGRLTDIAHILSKQEEKKYALFNFTRSNEERINYGALEAIKDGLVMSSKFDSQTLIFNSPHVVCFANSPPRFESMSKDRWEVYTINDENDLTPYTENIDEEL